MERHICIESCQVDEQHRILQLQLGVRWPHPVPGGHLRLAAVFQGERQDRHYPLVARCGKSMEGGMLFQISASIQLEYVFYQYRREGEKTISLRFACCDLEEGWLFFEENIVLSAWLFEKRDFLIKRWKRWGKRLGYTLCTLLLPVWLWDGYRACKGKKPLHPAAKGMQGKKAVLYHAHGLVSGWTGYGYSIREMKTNYFKRQYDKECKKVSQTEGILFLSERRVEQGGNLDLVRSRISQEGGCRISEFLTTKPVHKLDWGELRQSAKLLAGARVVVLEDFFPQLHALSIRPETAILQMWHACGAFKLFGLSELDIVDHLEQSTGNHRNYTAALASGQSMVPFYSEAFGICERCVKPIGVPRTDLFFQRDYRDSVRKKLLEKYPVCQGKRVVLFAPTFRGSGNKTAYFPVERFPVESIMEAFPEDTVLILKNHPFVKNKWQVDGKYRERVLDLSEAEHINDLLFITSLLVTDYSSVIFEAALLHIPMLFYAFDLAEYLEERNLYFDFASFVPGAIVTTVEELTDKLKDCLEGRQETAQNYEGFCHFFLDSLDGHSTERTVELIREMVK